MVRVAVWSAGDGAVPERLVTTAPTTEIVTYRYRYPPIE